MINSTSLYTSEKPLVSICCPAYNHERFIADALDGFLMQKTNFPVEILINDDCSTDNTVRIIEKYHKQFPGIIKPIYQSENQYSKGVKPLSQILLPRCKGKYVAFCEGDDFWTDELKLQKQVDFLESNPEFSMCHTNYSNANEKGEVIRPFVIPKKFQNPRLSHLEILEYFTPRTLTVMFKKETLQKKVPKENSLVANGDTFLYALVAKTGPVAYLDFNSGCHRFNKNSVYAMKPKLQQNEMLYKTLLVLKTYFTEKNEQRAINSHLSRRKIVEALILYKNKKYWVAFKAIILSLKHSRKPYFDRLTSLFQ